MEAASIRCQLVECSRICSEKYAISQFYLVLHFYIFISLGFPRTNNVAEGWNSAFSAMNGVKRPTIYRFIDNLKKDQAIARAKIIDCLACKPPPSPKKKYVERDASLKLAVENYIKAQSAMQKATEEAQTHDEVDSDDSDDENDAQRHQGSSTSEADSPKQLWLKSPAKQLLSAVAFNIRL